jgi:murein DD-endopeptidase MepM/ murein hydrolase activator NlpD
MGRLRGLSVGLGLGLLLSGCYPNVSEPWWNQSTGQRPAHSQNPRQPLPQPLPPGMIEVAKGETVYALSRRYNVGVREIIDANNLQAPFKLLAGQRLKLPPAALAQATPQPQPQSPAQQVQAQPLPPPAAPPPSQQESRPVPAAAFPPPITGAQAATLPPSAAPILNARPEPAVMPEPKPKAGKGFLWPVRGELVESFGTSGKGQNNDGINIAARKGEYVRASENGVVVYAGSELKGFGNLLLVKHQNGWVSAYAHNELLLVGKGDSVARGQAIARVGASGHVKSPQLHFELRHNSKPVDPLGQLVEG